ncbi:MAG: LysM peptidoglycan-binding domain-containing protein [Desulfobacter sp.]|nr:MAG: LysM peptidoglycan-binding domain-containing protein [Desulfobacter sp.]
MAGQIKNIASIKTAVLLFILVSFFAGTAAWAQAPQPFDVQEDTGFYYTIKKGDTLWDLSQKFYNSQWDWPGLWEMNKKIKNPHWIYPGNRIRVYLKPEFKTAGDQKMVEASSPAPITPQFNFPAIDHIGFIKDAEIPALGTIIREQDGNLMMSSDDIIYIRPLAPLTVGMSYQIFNTELVEEKINGSVFKGVKHLIKGKVKILDINDRYATALITASNRYATIGDKIMIPLERNATLTVQEKPAPLDGVILCSEDNERMVNDYKIAFINKGKFDNVRPGQIYSVLQVQQNLSVHDVDDVALLDPLNSGRLIVLHTEPESATVMVLSSKREILPGDLVR